MFEDPRSAPIDRESRNIASFDLQALELLSRMQPQSCLISDDSSLPMLVCDRVAHFARASKTQQMVWTSSQANIDGVAPLLLFRFCVVGLIMPALFTLLINVCTVKDVDKFSFVAVDVSEDGDMSLTTSVATFLR